MTTLQQLASGQNNAEVPVNENFETLSAVGIFGKRHSTTTGLTWGYYGGAYDGNTVSNGTVTLADDAVNVLVVERATGTVSATDGSDALDADTDYAVIYEITTASGVVTAVIDRRMDENGLLLGGAGGGGGSGTVTHTGGALTANAVMLGAGTDDSKVMASLGTSGQVLTSAGAGTPPTWTTLSGAGSKTYAVFTPMTSQPPASNYATLDTRNSIAVLDFDDTTSESAFWVGIMPEGASLGSGLKVRIHWMATSATANGVTWAASFETMTTDEDSDSFDTATNGSSTTSGTSGIITVTEITCTSIDSVAAGNAYRLKIARLPADGSDAMVGDAEIVAVEVRSAA
jgi:hypothetical protein